MGPERPMLTGEDKAVAKSADALVAQTLESLDKIAAPSRLQEVIEQHKCSLLSLASALLKGGQSEELVQATIDNVCASFKQQLVKTIIELRS